MRFVLLLAWIVLPGCAGLDPRVGAESFEFELSGRIAVRYRDEAASGNLAWKHALGSDEMLITTPIGSSVARILRNDGVVLLTTSDGREYRAVDAEELTGQVLGFRLPLVGLADWVRGRPVNGPPAAAEYDAQGRLVWLEQNGWRVAYQVFRADGLPGQLSLSYPGIELRLAIHTWIQGRARLEPVQTPGMPRQ